MIKVFLICSGLGQVKRGYESFTRECFDVLSAANCFDITLFKGGGKPSKKEIPLWNLPRQKWLTNRISQFLIGTIYGRKDSYFTEQLSFFFSLLPHIYLRKPDIIYFSDESVGDLLWHWRRLTKQSYKLLFRNGGPTSTIHNIFRWDYVHQLAPAHLQTALDVGLPAQKQTLLPNGFKIPFKVEILKSEQRQALRRRLELPERRPLILSVGAVGKAHKRMDYLIREIAALPEPRPYLLMLGQKTDESPEIFQLANELLGTENFQIRTVPHQEMPNYYKIADAFVLASLHEGFGRVFAEAMSHGLPCMAHDYEVAQYVLGEQGYFADFKNQGSLTSLIPQALAESHDPSKRIHRHQSVHNRFSWEKLRPEYIKLIQTCYTF
ncbi:MAG: glycosyltransferase [Fischerella sp.]|nr:glycosyltransferase [Fischerella sp.]